MGVRKPVSKHRPLAAELLESRYAFSVDQALTNAASLSLSFVPDGTLVAGQGSTLSETFDSTYHLTQWQQTVAKAFQTWAQYADISVGIVPDAGQPLGTSGLSHNDDRFGDIRIAAVPLAPDIFAEAIGHRRTFAGTWAADVVFNSDIAWDSAADLFAVALHEAGHVLGLGHSESATSVMHIHGDSSVMAPTDADIAALRAIYGARRDDVFDRIDANETFKKASRIPHAEVVDGFDGTTPLVVYGDIRSAADHDVFELPLLPGYTQGLTFDLRTSGLSQLQASFRVLDRDGNTLASGITAGSLGETVRLQIPHATGGKYYLEVRALGSDAFCSGSYAIIAKYDELLAYDDSTIAAVVLQGHRWKAETDDSAAAVDIRRLLPNLTNRSLDDDLNEDDSLLTARRLSPTFDTAEVRSFQFVGTIASQTDIDVHRVRAQSTNSPTRGLTVAVEAFTAGGLIPEVRVYNKSGTLQPTIPLASGNGTVVLRATGVIANEDYTIEIRSRNGTVGSYALTASFDDVALLRSNLATGQLTSAAPITTQNLYVAQPQLFSFALNSNAFSEVFDTIPLWMTVFDAAGHPRVFAGTVAGEFRSAPAALLEPGSYRIVLQAKLAAGEVVSYTLLGEAVSEPLGPQIVTTGTELSFACPGTTGAFCYPNQAAPTTDPYAVADPINSASASRTSVVPPSDSWYWSPASPGTNPINSLDADADGFVAPNDALLIINYLNTFGPASAFQQQPGYYLDPSGDGYIAPLDALLIINQLNTRGAAGEDATIAPQGPPLAAQPSLDLLFAEYWNLALDQKTRSSVASAAP